MHFSHCTLFAIQSYVLVLYNLFEMGMYGFSALFSHQSKSSIVCTHPLDDVHFQCMHYNCPLCSRESKVGVAKKNSCIAKNIGPLSLALKSVAVKDEKCHSQQALNCLLDHVCSTCLLGVGLLLCRPSAYLVCALKAGVCSEGLAY